MSLELKAMRRIMDILGELEIPARERVLAWVAAKSREEIATERMVDQGSSDAVGRITMSEF